MPFAVLFDLTEASLSGTYESYLKRRVPLVVKELEYEHIRQALKERGGHNGNDYLGGPSDLLLAIDLDNGDIVEHSHRENEYVGMGGVNPEGNYTSIPVYRPKIPPETLPFWVGELREFARKHASNND